MNMLDLQASSCRVAVALLVIPKIAGFAPSAEEAVSEPSVASRSCSKRGENEDRLGAQVGADCPFKSLKSAWCPWHQAVWKVRNCGRSAPSTDKSRPCRTALGLEPLLEAIPLSREGATRDRVGQPENTSRGPAPVPVVG